MSAICAVLSSETRIGRAIGLDRALAAAASRGEGFCSWSDGRRIALGQLASQTPSPPAEPVGLSRSARARVMLDGRIDNRSELLAALPTPTGPVADAELIARCYESWGPAAVSRLIGDFAFVLWDPGRERLIAARDALGVKPLYFHRSHGRISIASQARQLLALRGVPRRLDEQAMGAYLVGRVEDERTLFDGIRSLPAGHMAVAHGSSWRIERYWLPETIAAVRTTDPRAVQRQFDRLLEMAVDCRRGTETPIGVQLSGGLDSAAVAASAAGLAGGENVLGLSAVFDSVPACDERPYIEPLCEHLGIGREYFRPEGDRLLAGDAAGPDDESPFAGWAATEARMVELLARRGGRTILTGHGGDSVLYGSPLSYAGLAQRGSIPRLLADLRSHAARAAVPLSFLVSRYVVKPLLPVWVSRTAKGLLNGSRHLEPPGWLASPFAARTGLETRLRHSFAADSRRRTPREQLLGNLRSLEGIRPALHWLDRLAARVGVEARHPLLDRRLAEFALALPDEAHYRAGRGKLLLRASLADRVPSVLMERRRKTIFTPFRDHLLRGEHDGELRRLFANSLLIQSGVLEPRSFRQALDRYLDCGDGPLATRIWPVASLERWLQSQWNEGLLSTAAGTVFPAPYQPFQSVGVAAGAAGSTAI